MLTRGSHRNTASCLESNARWRRQAQNLRDASAQVHLQPEQQARLLREAEIADRQADWWLNGAIKDG